jgi:hypothetical protein
MRANTKVVNYGIKFFVDEYASEKSKGMTEKKGMIYLSIKRYKRLHPTVKVNYM